MESSRDQLLALEKTGQYLFHGSMGSFESLEPRQAINDNELTRKREQHGEPAICATPFADVAIFSALIKANAHNIKDESNCRYDLDGSNFETTPNLLAAAQKTTGKVYVLDKNDFQLFGGEGYEWRSDKNVVPVKVIEVTAEDLPKNIKVIE